MAAAVGRGRSRGFRGVRPPGVSSPTINSQIPVATTPAPQTPPADPLNTAAVPVTPPSSDVTNTPQTVASSCLSILSNPQKRTPSDCYRDCIDLLKDSLNVSLDTKLWVEACIKSVYGNTLLTQEFVQMICVIQQDQSVPNSRELLAVMLRTLNQELERLKPATLPDMSIEQGVALAAYTVLLAEVALHIKTHSGNPIKNLTKPVLECLKMISRSGLPDQVYEAIHHVLVRYGQTFEAYLEHGAPTSGDLGTSVVTQEVKGLYDSIRCIVINDATTDRSRLLMLEVVERRAYQYRMPEECLNYYKTIGR